MSKLFTFLKDVRVELSKVTWPTQRETTRYTVTVIVMALAVAIFLAIWDQIFSVILERILI